MNHSTKRHHIAITITKAAHDLTLHLYHNFFPLLRRLLSKSIRFMDSLLFSSYDDDNEFSSSSAFPQSFSRPSFSDPGESLFLVSFRWWEEAACGGGVLETGVGRGVLYSAAVRLNGDVEEGDGDTMDITGFRESEILLSMRREAEVGISGREKEEDGDSAHGDLALVSEWMFLTALKWHYDKKVGIFPEENSAHDLFSLQIRLLYETNLLVIKISEKDNEVGTFNRAYRIFCAKSGMLQIWDFSGQTNQLLLDDRKQFMGSDLSNDEIRLELQIYGLSCSIKEEERRKEDMEVEQSTIDDPSSSSSTRINGFIDNMNLFSEIQPSFSVGSGYSASCTMGLTGLYNLGNTCFMNSALQCLVHTPMLVDYFLGNFRKDLNFINPLGMNGKLAIAFGDLLRKLWAAGETSISPRLFKSTISRFAPQFSGYNQHDSQEFLAFLLDGLHEDLNRVKSKPYIQTKDEDGRPDEVVADEYWGNHLSRNDSIIVDLCQGQYRSMLFCPVCGKLSITFDPFMYLSLPLISTTMREMTLTVLSSDGVTMPHPVTIKVSNNGTFKDLVEALAEACSLRDDETLIIAEIYSNSIFRYLEDSSDLLELIRDNDQLVAYRLPKDGSVVAFMHQQEEKSYSSFTFSKKFGTPLLARMSNLSKGSEIRDMFLKLINPLYLPSEEFSNGDGDASQNTTHCDENVNDAVYDEVAVENLDNQSPNNIDFQRDFEFHMETGIHYTRRCKIEMEEPVPISNSEKPIEVLVTWPEKMIEEYDTSILSALPAVYEPALMSKRAQDSIPLYKCIEAFLKEEPLGPEDMWYCPNCKDHRQASKKLDLWRLPEILVIHLKRFSYNRFFKNKLETFVDFPVDDFYISNYVIHKNDNVSHRYALYAVSNHYGGMGSGHYTAFVKHGHTWYEFDDSRVFPVAEEQIKTPAAYVLFYRRV